MPRAIEIDGKRYREVEDLDDEIAPTKELAKAFQTKNPDVKEKITGAKVVEDRKGEKVLLLTGFRFKQKDRSKRMVLKGGEVNPDNIVAGTRRRKNVNYKDFKESKGRNSSKNLMEKRLQVSNRLNKKSESKKGESKKRKNSELSEDEADKENVENAENVENKVEKSSKKKKTEWTYPISKKNCDLIKKLGGKIKEEPPRRKYGSETLPDAINAFTCIKWPTTYTLLKKATKGKVITQMKHECFILDSPKPKWCEENPDAVAIAEGDAIIFAKTSEDGPDFKVYVVLEETDDEEEVVYSISLSKYLSHLKKEKSAEKEQDEEMEEATEESQETESQEETRVEARDEAADEKVELVEEASLQM